jgi:tRNA(Ile)-lysidine synthase
MRVSLERKLLHHIRNQDLIPAGARVAVGVSGGADSVALFHLLKSIRTKLGVTLCVAHFDHCLRGAESDEDAKFVSELARKHKVPFFLERADVAGEARRNGWNVEDAARRLRYGFFRQLVEQGRATHVAVAHTADDQAETVLAHIIRGTGPTGMGGIHPVAEGIVRPLLGFRRSQLREYLATLGETWREDSSNNDRMRLRARIRHQLVPQLEHHFSDRTVEHLCALARLSREEQPFWDALVEDRYRTLVNQAASNHGRCLEISVAGLLNPFGGTERRICPTLTERQTPASDWRPLTERLVRRLYEESRGNGGQLTLAHVDQVIRLAAKSRSGKSVQLPGGIRVERNFDALRFARGSGSTATEETNSGRIAYQYVVGLEKAETRVLVREMGICFHLKTVDWGKARSDTTGDTRVLDADSISAPLILRNWLPGDAYTPRGRSQPRKLKQMFLAARVPTAERNGWPVLESRGRVIWARRMPPARDFYPGERTRLALLIEEEAIG